MTACPVCSGATDVPDGKGGIMPCPKCSAVPRSKITREDWVRAGRWFVVRDPGPTRLTNESFGKATPVSWHWQDWG